MDTKTIIETAEEHLIHTYNRYRLYWIKGTVCIYTTQTARNNWISVPVLPYLH